MNNYILIDPVNKDYSGITSYSRIAYKLLKNIYNVYIISKENNETLYNFKQRIKYIIENNFSYEDTIIECPDTYNTSFYINKNYNIHVRLHGMKHIFDEINNNRIDINNYLNDLYQIQNCSYISSPSNIIKLKTEKYIHIEDTKIYPNPIPNFKLNDNKDIDILYIGRAQKNKGIYFLESILSSFIDKNVYIYGKEIKNIKLKNNKNINKIEDNQKEKREILKRTKTIIIPSYLESFSQVAAEGISNGCKIVTWDSVGISEYPGSMIYRVKFGHIDEFIDVVKKSILSTIYPNEFIEYINKNNNIYMSSIKNIKFHRLFYSRPAVSNINFNIEMEKKIMFKKKIKKLFRDPKQYWKDSKINKKITSILHYNKVKDNNSFVVNIITNLNTLNLYSKIDKDKIVNNYIGINSLIKSNDISIKARDRNTIIFINENNEKEYKIIDTIIKNCHSINFSKNYCFEYLYKDSIEINEEDIRNIIKTFTPNFKDTISQFKIAIFIDPNTKIFSIIKSVFPNLKIIVILTNIYKYIENISNKYIDMLFIDEQIQNKIDFSKFRRYFLYKNEYELCTLLDLYTNEISQKHHNMLLKIFGDVEFDTKYQNINTDNINCIIVLNSDLVTNQNCFPTWDEYIKYVSRNIKSIMVSEKVFFDYKELLLNSINNNDWYVFLLLSSYDGVRFEVYA